MQLIKINTIFEIVNIIFQLLTEMEPHRLIYKNSLLNYYRFGLGPKAVVCFHGYGEDGLAFAFLEEFAGSWFTFYSIDLPFHGKTVWSEGLNFSVDDLQLIVEKIVGQHTDTLQTATCTFCLMGYSLGGRVALTLYEKIPNRISKLILLAPDGLKVNFWYWLATQTRAGNKFFKLTMKKPGWFFGVLKILNKLKLVNTSIFKFVNYYIGDTEIRQLLYTRWTALRKIKPTISLVKKNILFYKTPVRLIYGKHDRIILPSVGQKFKKEIEEYCTLTIIDSGHQVVHEKHVKDLLSLLLH